MTRLLRLAVGIATALSGPHEKAIHKDVKPANVLVDPATGQARLMGFGIASRFPRGRRTPEPPEFIAGTLLYMAREQTGRMGLVHAHIARQPTLPFAKLNSAELSMHWIHGNSRNSRDLRRLRGGRDFAALRYHRPGNGSSFASHRSNTRWRGAVCASIEKQEVIEGKLTMTMSCRIDRIVSS